MLHRENQILGVEELMYIIYLIMILNVQQVLLKAILCAIIVAHGPVEMSFGCFCCNQNRGIFIYNFGKECSLYMTNLSWFLYVNFKNGFHIPLSESSVNHFTPSSHHGPLQIFFISLPPLLYLWWNVHNTQRLS